MFKKFLLVILLALSVSCLHAQTVAYVTNQSASTVSVIDTSTNTVTATMSVGSFPVGVVFSPDGARAYVTDAVGNISVIDTGNNTVTTTIHVSGNFLGFPAITPDGKSLYVPDNDGGIVDVVSTATNSVIATIPVAASAVVITPDGARAYALGSPNVSVIDTATNTVVALIAVTSDAAFGRAPGIAVNPAGSNVYVAGGFDQNVSVIATASNTVVATIPISGGFTAGLVVTPDGGRVYITDEISSVHVLNTARNTVARSTIPVGSAPSALAVTPDGASVYVANIGAGTVSVIDTATNTVSTTIPVGSFPDGIAIANLSAPMTTLSIENLVINSNLHEQGDFTLGANSGGIDLAHQPLTLTVNNFSLTIPAGSFKQVGGNMHFVFNGTVNGLNVNFNLQAEHGSSTQFDFVFDVEGVSISGPNPANVSLGIGSNSGSTTAPF